MRDVAIVGAGDLGGSLAYLLARCDVAATVRLIDERGDVARGKALDITQCGAVEIFSTQVAGATDLTAAAGASVIVVADRFSNGEWQDKEGLLLLQRLRHFADGSIIVCAAASQCSLVEDGIRHVGLHRDRIFGTAPEALASALRAIVALEANCSPQDVALTVLGIPPGRIVIPWEDATIGGLSAIRVLDASARRRVTDRAMPLWPPGPGTLAAAAAKAVAGLFRSSRQRISAFIAPADTDDRRTRVAALPVSLNQRGIERVALPALAAHERVLLDNAMQL
jgi:malate dehydrogenase